MTARKRFLRASNLFFVILLLVQLLPDTTKNPSLSAYVVGVACMLEFVSLALSIRTRKQEKLNLYLDLFAFVFAFLLLWTLTTAKFNLLKEALFPAPGRVFAQFIEDRSEIAINVGSSLGIILEGYLLAAAIAIVLGLFIGWNSRIGSAAGYLTKFFSSIPPIVYIPYGIALLPTFRSVSVMVIFLATFWPVFGGTMSGVLHVEEKLIHSAKVLNVSKPTMLFSVILPASLPQIFLGCNQGLTVSFILLTSAEMIGAQHGMGFYVKQYSDFGDYTRTIAGLLVIGIIVTLISALFNQLQSYLLRWRK